MVKPFNISNEESLPKNNSIGKDRTYLNGRKSDICWITLGIMTKGMNLPEKKNIQIPNNSNIAAVSSNQKAPKPIHISTINISNVDTPMATINKEMFNKLFIGRIKLKLINK